MKIKRAVLMAVLAVAVAALVVPMVGFKTSASAPAAGPVRPLATPPISAAQPQGQGQHFLPVESEDFPQGEISSDTLRQLGMDYARGSKKSSREASKKIKKMLTSRAGKKAALTPQSGQPEILNATSALSAAVFTSLGGRDQQFSEVVLYADWDGREDTAADRSAKVDDFSFLELEPDQVLTRTAISEHTFANGFTENVFYYADSVGNVWVGVDTTGDGFVEQVLQINIPTTLNAFGTILGDDQVTITGLGVNPVADLTSFANVNGAFASFAGLTGEILYVTYTDTESGLRLAGNNIPVRSGVLAFPIADIPSGALAPPGIISDVGFPIQVGGAFGVAFSVFSNIAGVAVDDDGNIYFQNVDLIQFTGGNIVKATDTGADQDRSLAVSGILTITTLNPAGGQYGSTSGPATQVNTFTNYSGTSATFGNVMYLTNGPCNTLYAAVSRSANTGGGATEGPFPAPGAFATGLPSMVISFADCAGAFDGCSGLVGEFSLGGQLPVANSQA